MNSPTRITPVRPPGSPPPPPGNESCPGCGAPVTGRFCPICGQRTSLPPLSVRALLRDYLDDSFSLNATLPRTLVALFFRPGHLTREYLRQRISPYVPPFRLYLVTSLIFFLIVAFRAKPGEITASDRAEIDSVRVEMQDSAAARAARGETTRAPRVGVFFDPTRDNWADNIQVNLGIDWLDRAIRARLQSLGNLPANEALSRILRGFAENTPKVMFLLLPLYALLLKLLYVRSKRYYVEHFIFALHGHAFAFSLFVLLMLPGVVPHGELPNWLGAVAGFLFLWLMIYYWVALKRVYQQGWFKTTVKWLVLGQVYAIVVACGLVLAFVAAIFTV